MGGQRRRWKREERGEETGNLASASPRWDKGGQLAADLSRRRADRRRLFNGLHTQTGGCCSSPRHSELLLEEKNSEEEVLK